MTTEMSNYERRALQEIREWRNPKPTLLRKVGAALNKPFDLAGEAVMKIPGAEVAIAKSIGGLVSLLNEGAQSTVRPEAVYREYRSAGSRVTRPADVFELDLEQVDAAIGFLGAKYKTLGAAEGAAAGALGLPGIPVDVIALVGLNLRAAGEYATYCGFDVTLQQERIFTMQVLGLASSVEDGAKQVMLAELAKVAKEIAQRKVWKELERHAFVQLVKKIAQALGIRLTKAKLAQIIPAAGAAVGGGFNAYYTKKICDASHYLYRERFLAEKYGPNAVYES